MSYAGAGIGAGAGAGTTASIRNAERSQQAAEAAAASAARSDADFRGLFGDYDVPTVEVASSWRRAAHTSEAQCETEPLYYADAGCQVRSVADGATQTEELEGDSLPRDTFTLEGWAPPAEVANFLLKVAPAMNLQLQRNASSLAFDGACRAEGQVAGRCCAQDSSSGALVIGVSVSELLPL